MSFFKKHWLPISVVAILAVMFVLMFFSSLGDSPVVDEIAHIPSVFPI